MSATIKDVAKVAGVSIATVSRLINNNYPVSMESKKKILDAIAQLDYSPNSIARGLKNGVTCMIGFLISDISNGYFTTMAKAIESTLGVEEYNVIVCSTENSPARELKYLELLHSKRVDGLIINSTGKNEALIARLSKKLPVALISRKIGNEHDFSGDFLDGDNTLGSYDLTKRLLRMGHRKIWVLGGPQDLSTGRERFAGFRMAMAELGIEVDSNYPYLYHGDFTLESGYAGAARLFESGGDATAIFAMNNAMAMGAIKYLSAHGIKVPEEISIVCFGGIENIELLCIKPTIAEIDPFAIGVRAAEMVLERIKNGSIANREVIFHPRLVDNNSISNLVSHVDLHS